MLKENNLTFNKEILLIKEKFMKADDPLRFTKSVINKIQEDVNIMKMKVLQFLQTSSHWRCSVGKGVLKNFAKFRGKHLCQVFSRTSFFIEHLR